MKLFMYEAFGVRTTDITLQYICLWFEHPSSQLADTITHYSNIIIIGGGGTHRTSFFSERGVVQIDIESLFFHLLINQ